MAAEITDTVAVGGYPGDGKGDDAVPPKTFEVIARPDREYAAGSGYSWYLSLPKALSWAIDELSVDLGTDIFDRMLLDSQCRAAVNVLKSSILEDGITVSSAVKKKDQDGYKQAAQLADDANTMLSDLTESFDDIMWDMLDAVALGYRMAEQVYELETTPSGLSRYTLTTLKVKPRESTAFVVDAHTNVLGIIAKIPGVAWNVMQGSLYSDLQNLPNFLPRSKFAILSFRPKNGDPRGTALDPETPIPTPDGWRKLDDLQVGSKVFDERGRIRYITGRKDWEDRPCYTMTFRDGCEIVADENHQWPTQTVYEKTNGGAYRIRTTREIAEQLYDGAGRTRFGIIQGGMLDYPEQALPLHPYYFGLWLGDGTALTGEVACHISDQDETVSHLRSCGYEAVGVKRSPSHTGDLGGHIRVQGQNRWAGDCPQTILRAMGMKNNKRIPASYLRGSVQQRIDLLAGLMDSDGYVDADGRCEFANTNKNLVEGVGELVRSLGSTAKVHLRKKAFVGPDGSRRKEVWATKFTPMVNPFRLERKRSRHISERPYKRNYITSVEKSHNRRTVCIEVDGPSHLYLAGESMIPTHNSVLRAAFDPWNQKQQLKREYLKYLTQFASPAMVGYTSPDADPYTPLAPDGTPQMDGFGNPVVNSPQQDMVQTMQTFMNGVAMAFANGSEVEFIQMQGDGAPFLNAFSYMDLQIIKAVLHQTLATEEGQHQTRASSGTHKDVLDTIVRGSKRPVTRMWRRDVLQAWVLLNAGKSALPLTPTVSLGDAEQEDRARLWTSFATLVASGSLTDSQITKMAPKLGIPEPEDGEVRIVPTKETILDSVGASGAGEGGKAGTPPEGNPAKGKGSTPPPDSSNAGSER